MHLNQILAYESALRKNMAQIREKLKTSGKKYFLKFIDI